MPRLQVDGKSTRTLVSTLIDITSSVVEDTQHGNDTVGYTVRACNVRTNCTDFVDIETDSTSSLGNQGTSKGEFAGVSGGDR